MPVSSVLCYLSCHLVSGHIVFHQVSPSQLWSASILLSIYCHLQYLSRGIIFISPLNMSKPSQPLLSEEFRHHKFYNNRFHYRYIIGKSAIAITPRMSGSRFSLEEHSSPWIHERLRNALNISLGRLSMIRLIHEFVRTRQPLHCLQTNKCDLN